MSVFDKTSGQSCERVCDCVCVSFRQNTVVDYSVRSLFRRSTLKIFFPSIVWLCGLNSIRLLSAAQLHNTVCVFVCVYVRACVWHLPAWDVFHNLHMQVQFAQAHTHTHTRRGCISMRQSYLKMCMKIYLNSAMTCVIHIIMESFPNANCWFRVVKLLNRTGTFSCK